MDTSTDRTARRPRMVDYHGSLTDLHGRYYLIGRCDCDPCWDDVAPDDHRWELENDYRVNIMHVRTSSFTAAEATR